MVHVGFLSACDTNGPPSVANRFLQSCAWHQRFSTDVPGSLPMRVPPSSWMMVPPVASPYPCSAVGIGENTSPPISAISARKVSCMCFDCLYSWSDHFQWLRGTWSVILGMKPATSVPVVSVMYFPTVPLALARPFGYRPDLEFSSSRADSKALAASTTTRARTWRSAPVVLST